MSTSIVIVLCGAVRALRETRSAAVFRMPAKGITSLTLGATLVPSTNLLTSSSTILPSGPVLLTWYRSTPYSLANLLAAGEAMIRSSALSAGPSATASTSGSSSPGAVMMASVSATGTSTPSSARILRMTPDAGASTSYVTLSESTSTTGSPFSTLSPSFLNH